MKDLGQYHKEITEVMKQGFLALECKQGSLYKTLRRNLKNLYWEISMLKCVFGVHVLEVRSAVNKHNETVT